MQRKLQLKFSLLKVILDMVEVIGGGVMPYRPIA